MDDMSVAYNRVIEQVASEFTSQATGDDQFTVSVQTGLSGIDLAQMGGSFLSVRGPLIQSLIHSLTHSRTHPFIHSPTPHTHSPTDLTVP